MNPGIEVTGLYTYPIKSCRGLSHESMHLDDFGPRWDRRWMLVDAEGRFVTQRTFPQMALIDAQVDQEKLVVETTGRRAIEVPLASERGDTRPVVVWQDQCEAWDEGDEASAWFSSYLGAPLRLVRMADSFVRPANRKWVSFAARVSFADGFPILLGNEASLGDLNNRLAARDAQPVTMDRFRPNLVIRGASAWAEDQWKQIRIGSVLLDVVKPCTRCVITTTDQESGEIPNRGEPLATLATFRRWENSVIFAQNLVHRGSGILSVGERVEVVA